MEGEGVFRATFQPYYLGTQEPLVDGQASELGIEETENVEGLLRYFSGKKHWLTEMVS